MSRPRLPSVGLTLSPVTTTWPKRPCAPRLLAAPRLDARSDLTAACASRAEPKLSKAFRGRWMKITRRSAADGFSARARAFTIALHYGCRASLRHDNFVTD